MRADSDIIEDCKDGGYVNPYWEPMIITVESCYYCWITDTFKSPVNLTILVVILLLSLGMTKMLIGQVCCRTKDGRPIDVAGVILGTTNMQHTKEWVPAEQSTCSLVSSASLAINQQEATKCNHPVSTWGMLLSLPATPATDDPVLQLEETTHGQKEAETEGREEEEALADGK